MKGWECPKCGNVYSPLINECKGCNAPTSGPIRVQQPVVDITFPRSLSTCPFCALPEHPGISCEMRSSMLRNY